MRIKGINEPESGGAWEALHRGSERESFDSPSRFELSTISMVLPRRQAVEPPPAPEYHDTGYDSGHLDLSAAYEDDYYADQGYDTPGFPVPADAPVDYSDREYQPPAYAARADTPSRGTQYHEERTYSAQDYLDEGFTGGNYPIRESPARLGAVPDYEEPPAPSPIYTPPERPPASPTGYAQPAVPSSGSRVRPYARTGGRTRSVHDLALEALVSTSDNGRRYRGVRSVEHRRICDLCLETRSVAEIAAYLVLPLGVVKVLVGDMADAGLVLIHKTELILGDRDSREFMERVLQGLRNL